MLLKSCSRVTGGTLSNAFHHNHAQILVDRIKLLTVIYGSGRQVSRPRVDSEGVMESIITLATVLTVLSRPRVDSEGVMGSIITLATVPTVLSLGMCLKSSMCRRSTHRASPII